MSEEKKNYLASDLAAELTVPRTTLNDWLKSYAAYLETEPRGKRRAYTAKSLQVLREVAKMREEGKQASEIEEALAAIYGIRPEIAPEEMGQEETPVTELPAALEPKSGQLARISDDDMKRLFNMLEVQKKEREKSIRRFWIMALLTVLLLMVAIGVPLVIFSSHLMEGMEQERGDSARRYNALEERLGTAGKALDSIRAEQSDKFARAAAESARLDRVRQEELRKLENRRQEELKRLNSEYRAEIGKISAVLDKQSKDYKKTVDKLKADLENQRRERDEQLKKLLNGKNSGLEAEIIRQKEEFASQQKVLLEKLEEASRKQSAAEAELKKTVSKSAAAEKDLRSEFEMQMNILKRKLETEKLRREAAEKSVNELKGKVNP